MVSKVAMVIKMAFAELIEEVITVITVRLILSAILEVIQFQVFFILFY